VHATCDQLDQTRRSVLSPAEERRRLAEAGDVDALYRILAETRAGLVDVEEVYRLILRAVEVAAAKDPAAFAERVFARMVGFTGYLLLRTHHASARIVARADRGAGPSECSRELHQVVLPSLMRLQAHLADLCHVQASSARLWALARKGAARHKAAGRKARRRAAGRLPFDQPPARNTSEEVTP
jgi:hypothetical protein